MSCKSHQPVTGTILVADDQAANRELLEELLTVEGFKVASVSTVAAALEQRSILPIDPVLLDVMMPNLTGFEVCEKIKASPDAYLIPVVLIPALSDTIRPYKPAFSITDALQTMKTEVAKGWWNPHIFSRFEQFVRSGTADFLSRGAGAGSNS
jgi:CheY-like chemotaxis protein